MVVSTRFAAHRKPSVATPKQTRSREAKRAEVNDGSETPKISKPKDILPPSSNNRLSFGSRKDGPLLDAETKSDPDPRKGGMSSVIHSMHWMRR